jgi:hypothetical protein
VVEGNNLNFCWYLLMTWRSHPTWFGFEDSYTEVRTLPTLCYLFGATVVDVIVFTVEK